MLRYPTLTTFFCIACSPSAVDPTPKAAPSSSGSVTVTSTSVAFPSSMQNWSATLRAMHDADAAMVEGEERLVYQLQAGAAATDDSSSIGLHVYTDDLAAWNSESPQALSPAMQTGVKNQLDARLGETLFVSDGGTFTVSSLESGAVSVVVDADLLELGEASPTGLVVTLTGAVTASCSFYNFEGQNSGTWDDVGLEDSRCAAAFD